MQQQPAAAEAADFADSFGLSPPAAAAAQAPQLFQPQTWRQPSGEPSAEVPVVPVEQMPWQTPTPPPDTASSEQQQPWQPAAPDAATAQAAATEQWGQPAAAEQWGQQAATEQWGQQPAVEQWSQQAAPWEEQGAAAAGSGADGYSAAQPYGTAAADPWGAAAADPWGNSAQAGQPYGAAALAGAYATASAGGFSPHGRPACAFGALVLGGRLLTVAPGGKCACCWHAGAGVLAVQGSRVRPPSMHAPITHKPSHIPHPAVRLPAGQVQLQALQRPPPGVLVPLRGAATVSVASELQQLESFPGPFSGSTKGAQVAKFCEEQADAALGPAAPPGLRTLWGVLGVLARHQGKASTAPYSAAPPAAHGGVGGMLGGHDAASTPEQQLGAVLSEGLPPAHGDEVLLPAAAPSPEAAAQVQQLLLAGRRADALRCAAWGARTA